MICVSCSLGLVEHVRFRLPQKQVDKTSSILVSSVNTCDARQGRLLRQWSGVLTLVHPSELLRISSNLDFRVCQTSAEKKR